MNWTEFYSQVSKLTGGRQAMAHCPFHDDKRPSLSIDRENGLWYCHGCQLGGNPWQFAKFYKEKLGQELKVPEEGIPRAISATYTYQDETGQPIFQVVRFDPKDFRMRKINKNGTFSWNMWKVPRVLYHLPEVLKSDVVFIVEGEKDADNLLGLFPEEERKKGVAAVTTNPGGAGKWLPEFNDYLKKKQVFIIPDNDQPGSNHAVKIANELEGIAKAVKIVQLPGLPEKGDISDWIESGGTREEFLKLCTKTPEFEKTAFPAPEPEEPQKILISFLEDKNILVEQCYDPARNPPHFFAAWDGQQVTYADHYKNFCPADPEIVEAGVVRLPSQALEYHTEKLLLAEIYDFIKKYLGLSEFFHELAVYYVLFSWVYDKFEVLPYLRAHGNYGTGKTRFEQIIGSVCYKGIFAGGAVTPSPIFRLLSQFRGTLVIDEADWRVSEEYAEIIKLFNCGFQKDFPVLRSEQEEKKRWKTRAFYVFGPKIVGTRRKFADPALESRFLTENMEGLYRPDIPQILSPAYRDEALELRNKLLLFRFRNYRSAQLNPEHIDLSIEPRLNQLLVPLASIIKNGEVLEQFKKYIQETNQEIIVDRGLLEECTILRAIFQCIDENLEATMKNITEKLRDEEFDKPLTTHRVGRIVRERLKLKRVRTRRGYIVLKRENEKLLNQLRVYYGLDIEESNP